MERLELSREYSLDPKSSAAAITPHLPFLLLNLSQTVKELTLLNYIVYLYPLANKKHR